MSRTDNVLSYSTTAPPGSFKLARNLLIMWFILSVLATPVGWLVGVGGTISAVSCLVADGDEWNTGSVEDWIGFVLWCANAVGFVALPLTWAVLCRICIRHLSAGRVRGAFIAERMCRWALAAGAIMWVGMLFGLCKALVHHRFGEIWWWVGLMGAVLFYGLATEYTRRVMRRSCISGG